MKYSKYIILYCLVIFSCSHHLNKVPEVSPHIGQENIYSSPTERITLNIFAAKPYLIYFTKQGQVIQFDPRTRSKKEVFSFGSSISSRIVSSHPYILFQTGKTKSFIVFNLKTMKIVHRFSAPKIRRILTLDGQFLYYYQKKRLVVHDYVSGKTVASRTIRQKIHHCSFGHDNVYILSTKRLYIYSRKNRTFNDYKLNINASSPFLLTENDIYFGSTNRQLVRFSLASKKIKWKFKLTQILTEKPILMGNSIVVTPEDHTICSFTPRGTLTWWTHLGDRRIVSPLVMKENIALFLAPRSRPKVVYVNIRKKSKITATCNTSLSGKPAVLGEFIYFFTGPAVSADPSSPSGSIQLNRMGNIYRTEVESKPEKMKSIGKTIRFELKPVNLIRPDHHISILDSQKQTVLDKKITWTEKSRFVWIPQKAGTYDLIVKSDARNISGLRFEEKIEIIDSQKLLNDHYFTIHHMCQTTEE